MVRACVVPGCTGSSKNGLFRFPCNAKSGLNCQDQMRRYSEWINAIGCEKLRSVPSSEVHKFYRICGKHFRKDMKTHFNGRNYLLPSAIPCVHLSAPQATETQTEVLNQPVQCESNSSLNTIKDNVDSAKLCTIDLDLDECNWESSIHEYKRPRRVENDYTSTDQHKPQEDFNDNNDHNNDNNDHDNDNNDHANDNNDHANDNNDHANDNNDHANDNNDHTNDNNDHDSDDDDEEMCVVLVTFDFINQLNQYKNDIDVDKEEMEKYDEIIKKKSIKLVKQIQINNEQNG